MLGIAAGASGPFRSFADGLGDRHCHFTLPQAQGHEEDVMYDQVYKRIETTRGRSRTARRCASRSCARHLKDGCEEKIWTLRKLSKVALLH